MEDTVDLKLRYRSMENKDWFFDEFLSFLWLALWKEDRSNRLKYR